MCALWSVLFVQPVRSDSKHFQVFKPLVYQNYLSELTRGEIYKISYWEARGSNISQCCWICSAIVSVCASGKICTLIKMKKEINSHVPWIYKDLSLKINQCSKIVFFKISWQMLRVLLQFGFLGLYLPYLRAFQWDNLWSCT